MITKLGKELDSRKKKALIAGAVALPVFGLGGYAALRKLKGVNRSYKIDPELLKRNGFTIFEPNTFDYNKFDYNKFTPSVLNI